MATTQEYKISSFDDLIEFIETQDVPLKDIEEIVRLTMNVIVLIEGDYSKSDLIEKLKDFNSNFKEGQERPLFIMDDYYE